LGKLQITIGVFLRKTLFVHYQSLVGSYLKNGLSMTPFVMIISQSEGLLEVVAEKKI
jgi:hypothetical protein